MNIMLNTIREGLNANTTDGLIGPKTWFYQKSTQEIKAMLKTLQDTATLVNDFQYRGNPKQRMLADEMSRNGGIGGIYKLMKTLNSELRRRKNERRIEWSKAWTKAIRCEKDKAKRNVLNSLYHRHSGVQDDYDYELLLKYLD